MAQIVFERVESLPIEKTEKTTECYAVANIDINTSFAGDDPQLWVRVTKGVKTTTSVTGQADVVSVVWELGTNHLLEGDALMNALVGTPAFGAAWEELATQVELYCRTQGWIPADAT